jgi:hypothetical protein
MATKKPNIIFVSGITSAGANSAATGAAYYAAPRLRVLTTWQHKVCGS